MKTFLLLILTVLVISCSTGERKCTIMGGIVGRKTNTLLLFKASRFPVIEAEIPISNSSFNYSFKFRQPEVYLLVFKDEFQKDLIRETPFFAESGKINFTIHSDNDSKGSVVKGHKLNNAFIEYYKTLREKFDDELMKYTDSLNVMYRKGNVFSKDFQSLQNALQETKDDVVRDQLMDQQRVLKSNGLMYNSKANKYALIQDSIKKAEKLWESNYIDQSTSLLSLYFFMNSIRKAAKANEWQPADQAFINKATANLNRFSLEFPDHPYCVIVKNTLKGLFNIHKGGEIVDFTTTNVKGDSANLSGQIKSHKLTLLNFWTIWSAPSIKRSKELMPVYKEYKAKGFEIVGITQEFGKRDELVSFIGKQNYPWPCLIDNEDKAGAWEKYNLSYREGGTFLVNSIGKILAVNPTVADLKVKLVELLK